MRISAWSSDVCSSDLRLLGQLGALSRELRVVDEVAQPKVGEAVEALLCAIDSGLEGAEACLPVLVWFALQLLELRERPHVLSLRERHPLEEGEELRLEIFFPDIRLTAAGTREVPLGAVVVGVGGVVAVRLLLGGHREPAGAAVDEAGERERLALRARGVRPAETSLDGTELVERDHRLDRKS